MVLAVKLKLFPTQSGPLFPTAGAEGLALIVTTVVPAGPAHPPTVAITE